MEERHQSGTTVSIEVDKTRTGEKLLIGKCVQRNRKMSMSIIHDTKQAEVLGNFFENFEEFLWKNLKS